MKTYATIFIALLAGATLAGPAAAPATNSVAKTGAPAKPAAAPPPRAIFTQPSSVRDGRDPFFPESTRPFEALAAAAPRAGIEITSLVVKGFSKVHGRPMVIINNHSFMVGDEGDVLVTGGRAHLRCAEIRSDTVVVEVNGARHEIHY